MGTGNEGRVGNRYGILEIGVKGKRRERRRGERCGPSFSSYTHQCLQNTVSHSEIKRSQCKRVPQFCLR